MKKKPHVKLALNCETIRELSGMALKMADGRGYLGQTCVCPLPDGTNNCMD